MSSLSETIKKADIFGQSNEVLYENGKDKLKTSCGLLFTLIMVFIIAGYAGLKANVMLDYLNNTIQEPIEENYFGLDFIYTSDEGWKLGFALVAYDSSSDQTPFTKEYGKLVVS